MPLYPIASGNLEKIKPVNKQKMVIFLNIISRTFNYINF